MTRTDHAYRHLMLAVTDESRDELHALALADEDDRVPSAELVDDLRQTLAGHTEVGRSLRLTSIVLGPIPRDPAGTTIAAPLMSWLRDNPCA
jgi:hypothetical protein